MYINPYNALNKGKGVWLKANFHTHAGTGEGTCGKHDIDSVISLYKEAGYSVLTISNHDIFSDTQEYELKYDMLLFNGIEYSQDKHILCIDIDDVISGKHQDVIDECRRQGGFSILCHPNWNDAEYWSKSQIDKLHGYTGIEIFNSFIFMLKGSGLATDKWDYILTQGKLAWGFANDDFHKYFHASRAWNMIYSPLKKHDHIKSSIENGSFYTTTGLILDEFKFDDNTLRVMASSKETYIKTNKYIFIGKSGQILDEQNAEFGQYKLSGDELYIRVQVVSEHGAMLWTQPIYRKESFKKA